MKKLNTRLLSAILAVVLFLSCCPVVSLASGGFMIAYEGKKVTEITVDKHEKITVTAERVPEGTLQWQIKIPGTNQWVDIQGQTGSELGLSYAVVGSLLEGNSALVRCAAISGGKEAAHTAQLQVTITEKVQEQPVVQIPILPVVTQPVEEPTEAPTEAPTEVPTEEPTEEPTETPTETPTEAPTEAPTEEPTEAATEAPTEEPTEAPTEAATEAPTETPTEVVVEVPTEAPAEVPTETPTEVVVAEPTEAPAEVVEEVPTEAPAEVVEEVPTEAPAEVVVEVPTEAPAEVVVEVPTEAPAEAVVEEPTEAPAEITVEEVPAEEVTETEAPAETKPVQAAQTSVSTKKKTAAKAQTKSNEGLNLVSITIQYIYLESDGTPAEGFNWPDYVANSQSGEPYHTTVYLKSIPGFEAVLAEDYDGVSMSDDGKTVVFSLDSVTESKVYTVCYREIPVPYHVRRFLQNVTNDLYTENFDFADEVFEGYPGQQPDTSRVYKEDVYRGFTPLFYQPDSIAADGSTVFEIYYDRNYYLINFDLNGGYGVNPIYARYGTNISVSTPTRPGYIFAGWKLIQEGNTAIAASPVITKLTGSVPLVNRTYQAQWETAKAGYSVEYWLVDDQDTADTSDDTRRFLGSRREQADSGTIVSGTHDLEAKNGWFCVGDDGSHEHDEEHCRVNTTNLRYMIPAGADENVMVAGDGSTAVNVYYRYKEYELIFYYARTQGGTDSNGDGVKDTGFTSVQTMGGSSYYFGTLGSNTADDATLLKNVGDWGAVTALPGLKRNQNAYKKGALAVDNGWDYHYISFKARYGDDISNLWPCDVIEPATRVSVSGQSWNNTSAVVSAWNGEYRVKYTRDEPDGNQTIKGLYQRLDEMLLIDTSAGWADESQVSFLCFWENGANVGWSVPELYVYNIWLPCLENDPNNAPTISADSDQKKETKQLYTNVDGDWKYIWYYLDRSYQTCDNSTISEQTEPGLTGYKYRETEWGAIFISRASKSDTTYTGDGGGKYYSGSQDVQSNGWWVKQVLTPTLQTDGRYLLTSADYDAGKYGDDVNPGVYREAYFRDFYYDSVSPRLFYKNHGENMGSGLGAEVPYGTKLTKYGNYFTPETMQNNFYPKNLEPNAYVFDGWYTSDSFQPEARMNWNTTMPDGNITVYAYWKPKNYDVRFYLDYEAYQQRSITGSGATDDPQTPEGSEVWYFKEDVSHGQIMDNLDYSKVTPSKDDYVFVRWVYEDEAGNKHSFEPTQMPVRQNLDLYAEWRSSEVSSYLVRYVKGEEVDGKVVPVTDAAGNQIELATPSTGHAVVSTTKTVQALTKNKLDKLTEAEKDQAWFPHTGSHSILMKPNSDDNVFTFMYVTKTEAKYTVHYRDEETGQEVAPSQEFTTKNAEETIWFRYVEGYVPDTLYKRLVLSANDDDNVLIFYYTKGATNEALYQVTHLLQTTDGTGYEVYRTDSHTALVGEGVIGEPLTIPGAEFDWVKSGAVKVDGKYVVQGIVKSGEDNDENQALELVLYYNRSTVDYTVRYVNQNDPNDRNMPVTETYSGRVGETVSAQWKEIPGYNLISAQTQTLKLSTSTNQNVITFFYEKEDVHVRYIAKCTEEGLTGFGVLDRSEDSGVQIYGATAMPYSGSYFVGWFSDEECQNLVQTAAKLQPELAAGVYEATYYALFKPYRLTIAQNGAIRSTDSAIYEVLRGTTVVARVMLTGNDSVTLLQIPAGTYTVRENTRNWTWTYGEPTVDHTGGVVTVERDNTETVTFTYGSPFACWLFGENKR